MAPPNHDPCRRLLRRGKRSGNAKQLSQRGRPAGMVLPCRGGETFPELGIDFLQHVVEIRNRKKHGSGLAALHPREGRVVTVPGQLGTDVPVGTLKAILRSAGLERREED